MKRGTEGMRLDAEHEIATLAELEALYGKPAEASLAKETEHLTPQYRRMIEAAPFFALASAGAEGLDCSPRGDGPGFVRVLDDRRLAFPDRRGNNRIDTLRNLLQDPRVALLFLVPGVNETLRVNGRAVITTQPELLESFAVQGKRPASALVVTVDSVYFQCARALLRSRLWDPATQVERRQLPSAGEMIREAKADFDAGAYDAALPGRQRDTLY